MKTIYTLFSAIILAMIILVGGCTSSEPDSLRKLKENENKWSKQSQLFNQNYTYTIRIGCFCPDSITSPVSILVTSGKTESIVYENDGTPATNEIFTTIDTVEDLFTIIRNAINSKADEILVDYNPILGYPSSISIDPIKNAMDEERGYTILDFAILK